MESGKCRSMSCQRTLVPRRDSNRRPCDRQSGDVSTHPRHLFPVVMLFLTPWLLNSLIPIGLIQGPYGSSKQWVNTNRGYIPCLHARQSSTQRSWTCWCNPWEAVWTDEQLMQLSYHRIPRREKTRGPQRWNPAHIEGSVTQRHNSILVILRKSGSCVTEHLGHKELSLSFTSHWL